MSEEEIIDYLKESIEHSEYNFENFGENNYFDKSTQNAVKELIDLYNKQKEEIESLESQLDFIGEQNRYIERQTIYLNKLEKELHGERIETEKMQKNYESVIDKMEYEMGYEYISKDKIRDKINEIKELQKTLATHEELDFQIDILEKLLEE